MRRVRHLVMVLGKHDELRWFQIEARSAAPFLLPFVPLPLVQVAPLHCGNELLRIARVVGVISFAFTGERDYRTMMKVIVPQCVNSVSTLLDGPRQNRALPFVLGHHDRRSPPARIAYGFGYFYQDVPRRTIEHLL